MIILISTYPYAVPASTNVNIVSINPSLLEVRSQKNTGTEGLVLVSIENPITTFDIVKGKQEITIYGNIKYVPTRKITIVIQ